MKPLHLLAFLLFTTSILQAQDLSNFQVVANYTLIDTDEDAMGNYEPIELVNAPYQGADGVFSYGGYLFDIVDFDSTLIETPNLDILDTTSFAFQVEFKTDSLVPNKPIIVAGGLWRYLGAHVNTDNSIRALHNGSYHDTSSDPLNLNQWYTLTLIHDSEGDGNSQIYLDGTMIFEMAGQLNRPKGDTEISNTHFGQGNAHRGWWRNLKVYGPGMASGLSDQQQAEPLDAFPNPFCSEIHLSDPALLGSSYSLYDMQGKLIKQGVLEQLSLEVPNSPNGTYLLQVISPDQKTYIKKIQAVCK